MSRAPGAAWALGPRPRPPPASGITSLTFRPSEGLADPLLQLTTSPLRVFFIAGEPSKNDGYMFKWSEKKKLKDSLRDT